MYSSTFCSARALITGPAGKFSGAGPTSSWRTRSAIISTTSPYTLGVTTTREPAEHFCPWYPYPEATTPATASSNAASSSTMTAFLPPISAMIRLSQI